MKQKESVCIYKCGDVSLSHYRYNLYFVRTLLMEHFKIGDARAPRWSWIPRDSQRYKALLFRIKAAIHDAARNSYERSNNFSLNYLDWSNDSRKNDRTTIEL